MLFADKKANVFVGMVSGWRRYMSHPMFFASVGYVLDPIFFCVIWVCARSFFFASFGDVRGHHGEVEGGYDWVSMKTRARTVIRTREKESCLISVSWLIRYCFLYFSVLDNGSLMTAYLMVSGHVGGTFEHQPCRHVRMSVHTSLCA